MAATLSKQSVNDNDQCITRGQDLRLEGSFGLPLYFAYVLDGTVKRSIPCLDVIPAQETVSQFNKLSCFGLSCRRKPASFQANDMMTPPISASAVMTIDAKPLTRQ
jgi:hypothetical protein